MATYKTLAIVDDVNTCDCCGKSNLKSTVAMERDDGVVFYFGCVCATRHSGRDTKTIRSEAETAYNTKVGLAKAEFANTDESINYNTTLNQARVLKIAVGASFREFTRHASDKAETKRKQIATKYGISPFAV
jgi:hypothetical protein